MTLQVRNLTAGQGTEGKVWLLDTQELEMRKSSVVPHDEVYMMKSFQKWWKIFNTIVQTCDKLEEPE